MWTASIEEAWVTDRCFVHFSHRLADELNNQGG
jgi:hypothetical protein